MIKPELGRLRLTFYRVAEITLAWWQIYRLLVAFGVTADVVGHGRHHDEPPVLVHELAVPPPGGLLLGRAEPVPHIVRVSWD